MKVLTIGDVRFDEYFGFTDLEVQGLLEYYQLEAFYGRIKEWYDGYHFGDAERSCMIPLTTCGACCTPTAI